MNTTPIKHFVCCALLLAVAAFMTGCGGGDDCDAGTGTFKPLPEECNDNNKVKTK